MITADEIFAEDVEDLEEAEIKREVEGHYDDNGQWVEPGEKLIATVLVDIQPKSGQQRANELGTEYESEYLGIVEVEDITFEPGYEKIKQDDKLIDEENQGYRVTFEGDWPGDHYELDLKYFGKVDNDG